MGFWWWELGWNDGTLKMNLLVVMDLLVVFCGAGFTGIRVCRIYQIVHFLFFFNLILFLNFYNIVLVLPNIQMDPPQVYMCSPSWILLTPPSSLPVPSLWVVPVHQPQASNIVHRPGLATRFIHDVSFLTAFILKSLSYMSIATPAFFWSLFAWNIFFQPLTFSLYMLLGLKWVSNRQHI